MGFGATTGEREPFGFGLPLFPLFPPFLVSIDRPRDCAILSATDIPCIDRPSDCAITSAWDFPCLPGLLDIREASVDTHEFQICVLEMRGVYLPGGA
jgi:hypothetical protein